MAKFQRPSLLEVDDVHGPKGLLPRWWGYLTLGITPLQSRSRFLRLEAKRLIDKGGTSSHTAQGATLPYMLLALEMSGTPYTLKAVPKQGYLILVAPPAERPEFPCPF